MLALQLLGWAGSALLVYSVLQTRILSLRILNGVASAVLAVFNAAIAVWPMVAMNLVLTAITPSTSFGWFAAATMLRRSK